MFTYFITLTHDLERYNNHTSFDYYFPGSRQHIPPMPNWSAIAQHITSATAAPFSVQQCQVAGGGCINQCYRLQGKEKEYFIKLNHAKQAHMFEAEALGLQEIIASHSIRVPLPICWGINDTNSYLVLEFIVLSRNNNSAQLGQQIAKMHKHIASRYGWSVDNTIGSTPQINTQSDDWISFWKLHRLDFQLELAREKGCGDSLYETGKRLIETCASLFKDYQPVASLLHGDLWSGNYASDEQGTPVVFDPAVYYGDREADLAMTELFGGFGGEFYAGYQDTYPLDAGYKVRKTFYNIYHILNHFNLFGGGYAKQAEHMIDQVLSEVS